MTENPVVPSDPAWPHMITDPPGRDVDEEWDTSVEGRDHGITLSTIHLSTTRDGFGPPRHQHPYTEVIMVLRGRSVFVLGTEEIPADAGQTVVIPPLTPHTFRVVGPDRYESLAMHLSAAFVTELLDDAPQ